jgi:hypothetical protein
MQVLAQALGRDMGSSELSPEDLLKKIMQLTPVR